MVLGTVTEHDEKSPQRVVVIGSTGSIGTQVLDVLGQFPQYFKVAGLAAGHNHTLLAQQVQRFKPDQVAIATPQALEQLALAFTRPAWTKAYTGEQGLLDLLTETEADVVVIGLVGIAGLAPTIQALTHGKTVLTANKETFVTGGHLVQPYLRQVITLDSEHSAILQCLKGESERSVSRLLLTASGGPFRGYTHEQLRQVSLADALRHPTWQMGQKITVDCATLMNKGLEMIEAHWLFGVDYDRIQVVVHPQSLVHSGVAFVDGSVLFQAGVADMRCPIRYGLSLTLPAVGGLNASGLRLPEPAASAQLDLFTMPALTFEAPNLERFPCLALAAEAGRRGPAITTVLNAADEVAVADFIAGKIGFADIPRQIERALNRVASFGTSAPTLAEVLEIDLETRMSLAV